MKQKTHMAVAGKLVRTDKQFRHLKQQQKENISLWLYENFGTAGYSEYIFVAFKKMINVFHDSLNQLFAAINDLF